MALNTSRWRGSGWREIVKLRAPPRWSGRCDRPANCAWGCCRPPTRPAAAATPEALSPRYGRVSTGTVLETLAPVPCRALRRRPAPPARRTVPGAPPHNPARSARRLHNVRRAGRGLAAFEQHIGQVDVAHGIAGMARRGFGIRGARRGSITGGVQQCAQVVERQAVGRRARQYLQIGVAGLQRAAELGRAGRHARAAARPPRARPRCASSDRARRLPAPGAAATRCDAAR